MEGALRPSVALNEKRQTVRDLVSRRRAANPRVFGSVARGDDRDDSDIDILVDALPGTTLLDLGGLQMDLEELLGVKVDLATPPELHRRIREKVLAEATPI